MSTDEQKKTLAEIDGLVQRARVALDEFKNFTQEDVDRIVSVAASEGQAAAIELAKDASEETGRGNFEHKVIKNQFACVNVANHMRDLRTVGVISHDEQSGITKVAEPIGVVAGATPVTNPTSTTMFKALMCLKTRNPIIFSFHPGANSCCIKAATIIRDAAIRAGAPENCIQWIEKPSMAGSNALMNHDGVDCILATGGNAMVRAAYSCGKPALGVGAGNVPAYIHKSSYVARAVHDVVVSKTFDNGMICASEQAAVLDDEIYDEAIEQFERLGAYQLTKQEQQKLEDFMFVFAEDDPKHQNAPKLNPHIVGKTPAWLAEQVGIKIPEDTTVLLAHADHVGNDAPMTREKLCPVLTILRAKDTANGIDLARQMVELDGLGHSATIHSHDRDVIKDFGAAVRAVRIVENAPTSQGAIGGIYNSLIPSLTLGCGSYGHNSVSGNVHAAHLINVKRIARRNPVVEPVQLPQRVYAAEGVLRELGTLPNINRVSIVTDPATMELGILDDVIGLLRGRQNPVSLQIIDGVEFPITESSLKRAVVAVRGFKPDTIVAVGETNIINVGKMVRALYENPELKIADLSNPTLSIDSRGQLCQLIAVPTLSGCQASISNKAMVFDPDTGQETLATQFGFMADVALIDRVMARRWDADAVASRGFENIVQSVEAFLSVNATDFSDALALRAMSVAHEHLETAWKFAEKGDRGSEALHHRDRMLGAGTMVAALFFATNTGIANAMAFATEEVFADYDVDRHLASAIFFPNVLRFLASRPRGLVISPNYEVYKVGERCEEMAYNLHLTVRKNQNAGAVIADELEKLRANIKLPKDLNQIGISSDELEKRLDEVALRAFALQGASGTPRAARLEELKELFRLAAKGNKYDVR